MTELEFRNMFSIVGTKIKIVEQVREYYGKELAPDFNSFDFWHIDENKVSKILAYFLDPNSSHEHGPEYLKHFLSKFGIKSFHFEECDEITVQCEFPTDQGRRIDVLIYKNSFEQAIGIENKIHVGTDDQNNQIKDYADFLSVKTEGDFTLIYLSPKDKVLSNSSISFDDREFFVSENKLVFINYEEQMIECISDFSGYSGSKAASHFGLTEPVISD